MNKEIDKKFVSVPRSDFDKVIFVANLSTKISGKPTSKATILQSIEERELNITPEQMKYIEENFE